MKHVDIPKMLKNAKTIAVFGLSAKPHRARNDGEAPHGKSRRGHGDDLFAD